MVNCSDGFVRAVRVRQGFIGEARRVCHLVRIPDTDVAPASLHTFCGTAIAPSTAELLTKVTGMPCGPCWAKAPRPETGAGYLPGVMDQLVAMIPTVTASNRAGLLTPHQIGEFGDLVYQLASQLWQKSRTPLPPTGKITGELDGAIDKLSSKRRRPRHRHSSMVTLSPQPIGRMGDTAPPSTATETRSILPSRSSGQASTTTW